MKVANVIEEARLGGPQRRIAGVAARLQSFGIETVVVGPQLDSEDFERLLEGSGVSYAALPLHGLSTKLGRLLKFGVSFVPEVWRLSSFLRGGGFDLVHVSGGSWQIKGVIAGRLAGLPIVWHLNDTRQPLPVRLVFALVSRLIRTDFIVAGRRVQDYYLSRGLPDTTRVFEIPAPVDTERFEPNRVQVEPELANHGGMRVITLASVNPDKGLETFVEMAAGVATAEPEAEFWVVGPTHETQTSYRERLDRLIESLNLRGRVRFFGATSDSASVLAAADVFVCTSRAEASPMAVWEAMAMARPVVSTDVGDVRLLVESSGAGRVVPVGDAEAAAEAVLELLRDPALRRAMGGRARATAEKHLSLGRCVDRHRAAYRSVAPERA